MQKRNRTVLLLLIPIAMVFWFFGWSLYWIGSGKRRPELEKRDAGEHLKFGVLVPKQEYAR